MGQSQSCDNTVKVFGYCDFNYIPVRNHLEQMLKNGIEENAQLCVYVEGECVLDLYAKSQKSSKYSPESNQLLFGSGMVIESILVGMLVDQGLIKLTDKITKYWPQFANNGKEETRICDILSHRYILNYVQN